MKYDHANLPGMSDEAKKPDQAKTAPTPLVDPVGCTRSMYVPYLFEEA